MERSSLGDLAGFLDNAASGVLATESFSRSPDMDDLVRVRVAHNCSKSRSDQNVTLDMMIKKDIRL